MDKIIYDTSIRQWPLAQTEGRNKREIAELKEHILEPQQNKTGVYVKLFSWLGL
jgi:hypothetical protein